jgi:hypothetical protein
MIVPARLIPLLCVRCSQPLPAQVDEVAWACPNCGQGQLLSQDDQLAAVEIHYSADLEPGARGRPFWVAQGEVSDLVRKRFKGDQSKEMQRYWASPRRFFVPAYEMSLEQIVETGLKLIETQPALSPGPPAEFLPVTVLPDDVRALAEFIVLAVEAARKDHLSRLQFDLQLGEAELWIIP